MTADTGEATRHGVTAGPPVPDVAPPGLGAAVAAEWIKLRTARAPRLNLALGVVLGVGLSGLLSFAVAATFSEWSPAEQADFDPIVYPLSGSLFVGIFFAAVGVNVVMAEYGSGMIRLTFTATPRRGRVLVAKAVVVSIATTIAGLVAMAGMLGLAQVIFAAYDLPTVGLGDADLWRTLAGLVLLGPLFPVLAVVAAFVARSTAAALSSVLALMFLPSMFGGLLPGWWQRNVLSLLPGPASDSLAIGHVSESPQHLEPVAAAVVVVVWLAASMWVARVLLDRRDP